MKLVKCIDKHQGTSLVIGKIYKVVSEDSYGYAVEAKGKVGYEIFRRFKVIEGNVNILRILYDV